MGFLPRLGATLDRLVETAGRLAGWIIFLLIGVTVFDVITRRFLVLGSTQLQELEWHFHAILFFCCLGYAYLKGAHVRIELFSQKFDEETRAWVEFLGGLFLILPFCGLLIWFGAEFVVDSWAEGERSASATGLGHRWAIKLFLPLGISLLALGVISAIIRNGIALLKFAGRD